MTSDSLAAWLARRLDASHLIFVKSVAPRTPFPDLVSEGILDPLVPSFLAGAGFETWLCGPSNLGSLAEALGRRDGAGMRVALA